MVVQGQGWGLLAYGPTGRSSEDPVHIKVKANHAALNPVFAKPQTKIELFLDDL